MVKAMKAGVKRMANARWGIFEGMTINALGRPCTADTIGVSGIGFRDKHPNPLTLAAQ